MTETELVPSEYCEGYFKTERFDRAQGKKIFTTTFSELLDADFRAPTCDYGTYFKLVNVLTRENLMDKEQLYRVMCFNALTHNRDDHTKNFSFVYTEETGWRLAPAYDLTCSDTYWGEHTTSINEKGKDFAKEDFIKTGTGAGLASAFCNQCFNEINERTKILEPYISSSNL